MLMRTKYLDNLHRDSSLSYYSSAKILLTLCSLIDSKMPFEHFFDDPLYHEWLPTLDDICARNDFHWPISLANEPGAPYMDKLRTGHTYLRRTFQKLFKYWRLQRRWRLMGGEFGDRPGYDDGDSDNKGDNSSDDDKSDSWMAMATTMAMAMTTERVLSPFLSPSSSPSSI